MSSRDLEVGPKPHLCQVRWDGQTWWSCSSTSRTTFVSPIKFCQNQTRLWKRRSPKREQLQQCICPWWTMMTAMVLIFLFVHNLYVILAILQLQTSFLIVRSTLEPNSRDPITAEPQRHQLSQQLMCPGGECRGQMVEFQLVSVAQSAGSSGRQGPSQWPREHSRPATRGEGEGEGARQGAGKWRARDSWWKPGHFCTWEQRSNCQSDGQCWWVKFST